MKIKSPEDFWSGIMFIGFGILAIVIARDYPMGSAMRMGPGYFPTWIGWILVVLGAIITATGFKFQGEGIGRFAWRPMFLFALGFIIFAWGIDNIGFVLSLLALIVLSSMGGRGFSWKEIVIESVVLIVGSWALFIYALGLPYPLFWS